MAVSTDIPEAVAVTAPLAAVRVFGDLVRKQMAELVLKKIDRPDPALKSLRFPRR